MLKLKISLISIFSVVFITACASAQPTKTENVSKDIIDNCLAITDSNESNKCLMKVATDMVYYKTYESDIQVCQKMSMNLQYFQECFWLFAFTQKDPAICEYLPEESKESKVEGGWFSGSIAYLTKSNCKNEFHLKLDNAEWKLVNGIPPIADPKRLQYKGSATIKGWIVKETGYTDELISYFHVSEESIKNLPSSIYFNKLSDFILMENDKALTEDNLKTFEKFSDKNPMTLKISAIEIVAEGHPLLTIDEIINR